MTSHTAMDANAMHVWAFYARKGRARRIALRRLQNATARRLGFKNYVEWQGDEA